MPSKKRKYNARFPAGRIKRIMRIDDDIGKVALPVPVMISRALELFVSSLLNKAGDITIQKNARTLTLTHLKQCIYSDSRLDFLKELVKDTPDIPDECNNINFDNQPILKKQIMNNDNENENENENESENDNGNGNENENENENDEEEPTGRRCDDHLCACRDPFMDTVGRFSRPAAVHAAAYLTSARALLRTCRERRDDAADDAPPRPRCRAVERACSALLSDVQWCGYVLDALRVPATAYAGHAAACVASEATLLCLAGDHQQLFVDGLFEMSVSATLDGHRGRAAAMNALARALNAARPCPAGRQRRRRRSAVERSLLDRLHGCWPRLVDAAVAGHRPAVLAELLRLWKSVFVASSTAADAPRDRYYATLPRLERVLYRSDTDPYVWLNTVELLDCGLCSRRDRGRGVGGGDDRDDHDNDRDHDRDDHDNDDAASAAELARRVAVGVTRHRLLYFMDSAAANADDGPDRAAVVQETVLLAVRSLRALGRAAAVAYAADVIDTLDSYAKSTGLFGSGVRCSRWLVRVTCDRDDALVECLTCALEMAGAVPAVRPRFDPYDAFAEFLACVSYDADVLLDYLVSDDAGFLPYSLRLLKSACADVRGFFRGCGDRLADTVDVLVRLRARLVWLNDRRAFLYNVNPIAVLIQSCHRSYCEYVARGRRHDDDDDDDRDDHDDDDDHDDHDDDDDDDDDDHDHDDDDHDDDDDE